MYLRLEAKGGERALKRICASRVRALRRQFSADFAASGLHFAQSVRSRGNCSTEPASQLGVGARRLSRGSCVRSDRLRITGPAAGLGSARAGYQTRLF